MAKRKYYSRTSALIGASRDGGHGPRRRRRRRRMPNIRWKIVIPVVLAVTALALFVSMPLFWFLESDTFHIHGVPYEMHRDVMIHTDMYGKHAIFLRPQDAEGLLKQAYPDMLKIEVQCKRIPAKCDVYFTLREPVLAWETTARMILIDNSDDVPYAYRETLEVVDMPIITGPLPDGEYAETELRQVLQGVDALRELDVPVDYLEYQQLRGLVWVDETGCAVAFGTGPNMQERWETYQEMRTYFESRGIYPAAMDVRFPAGVTYSQ